MDDRRPVGRDDDLPAFAVELVSRACEALRADIRVRMEKFGRNPDDCKILFLAPLTIVPDDPNEQPAMSDLEATAFLESMLVMGSSSMDLDLSKYDLDGPVDQSMVAGGHTSVLDGIKEAGRQGLTLREAMTAAGAPEETDFVGTSEQIAEQLVAVMDEVGGDGYLIQAYGASAQIPALTDRIVPAPQRAGAFRTEYSGSSLRDRLTEY